MSKMEQDEIRGESVAQQEANANPDVQQQMDEEKKIDVEFRYAEVRKPVFSFVLTAVIAVVIAVFALYAAPELMTMLENFMNVMQK